MAQTPFDEKIKRYESQSTTPPNKGLPSSGLLGGLGQMGPRESGLSPQFSERLAKWQNDRILGVELPEMGALDRLRYSFASSNDILMDSLKKDLGVEVMEARDGSILVNHPQGLMQFDKPDFTFADLMDAVGPLPEYLAQMAATVFEKHSPLMAAGAAGLTAGVARNQRDIIGTGLGLQTPQSTSGKAASVLDAASEAAIYQLAGSAITRVGTRVLSPVVVMARNALEKLNAAPMNKAAGLLDSWLGFASHVTEPESIKSWEAIRRQVKSKEPIFGESLFKIDSKSVPFVGPRISAAKPIPSSVTKSNLISLMEGISRASVTSRGTVSAFEAKNAEIYGREVVKDFADRFASAVDEDQLGTAFMVALKEGLDEADAAASMARKGLLKEASRENYVVDYTPLRAIAKKSESVSKLLRKEYADDVMDDILHATSVAASPRRTSRMLVARPGKPRPRREVAGKTLATSTETPYGTSVPKRMTEPYGYSAGGSKPIPRPGTVQARPTLVDLPDTAPTYTTVPGKPIPRDTGQAYGVNYASSKQAQDFANQVSFSKAVEHRTRLIRLIQKIETQGNKDLPAYRTTLRAKIQLDRQIKKALENQDESMLNVWNGINKTFMENRKKYRNVFLNQLVRSADPVRGGEPSKLVKDVFKKGGVQRINAIQKAFPWSDPQSREIYKGLQQRALNHLFSISSTGDSLMISGKKLGSQLNTDLGMLAASDWDRIFKPNPEVLKRARAMSKELIQIQERDPDTFAAVAVKLKQSRFLGEALKGKLSVEAATLFLGPTLFTRLLYSETGFSLLMRALKLPPGSAEVLAIYARLNALDDALINTMYNTAEDAENGLRTVAGQFGLGGNGAGQQAPPQPPPAVP